MTQDTTTTRRGRKPKTEVQPESNTDLQSQLDDATSANQAFAEQNDQLAKENDELRAQLTSQGNEIAQIKAMMAKNNPVIRNHLDDVDEVGIQGLIEESAAGFDLPKGNPDSLQFKSKMDYEAFMAEEVEIHISDNVEHPDHIGFIISVNGMKEYFRQGETKKTKRYFVEGLARARKTSFGSSERPMSRVGEGDNVFEYRANTGVRYPFSVVNDTRRGIDWLANIRRQA